MITPTTSKLQALALSHRVLDDDRFRLVVDALVADRARNGVPYELDISQNDQLREQSVRELGHFLTVFTKLKSLKARGCHNPTSEYRNFIDSAAFDISDCLYNCTQCVTIHLHEMSNLKELHARVDFSVRQQREIVKDLLKRDRAISYWSQHLYQKGGSRMAHLSPLL